MIALVLLLIFLAGCLNGLMDGIKHHWHGSKLSEIKNVFWWRFFHEDSWKNKYKDGWDEDMYYVRNNVPIFLTDAWHLAKSLMLTFLCAACAIGFNTNLPFEADWYVLAPVLFLVFRATFGAGFNLVYRLI